MSKRLVTCFLVLLPAAIWLGTAADGAKVTNVAPKLLASGIEVTLNPSGIAPLSALATFKTSSNCHVLIEIPDENAADSGSLPAPVRKIFMDDGTDHAIPIVGLFPGRTNAVLLTLFTHHGKPESYELYIDTDPLPAFFPEVEVSVADPDRMEPGMNLSTLTVRTPQGGQMYPIISDHNGVIRWYLDLSEHKGLLAPFRRIRSGNFLGGIQDWIYEYDMLGRLVDEINIPGYNFHHDIIELPDGNLVACVDKRGTTIVNSRGEIRSTGDVIIEIDRKTKSVLTTWDLREILDVDRNEQINSNGDWFHMNALWYSPDDHCLIVSGRHQGVIKVTWENKLRWILAPHQGWGNAGFDGSGPSTVPFLLTAVAADGTPYPNEIQAGYAGAEDFDWNFAQHYPLLLPSGNLLLFDNGDFRYFMSGFPQFSRCVEFRIDEEARTVEQIWQYGKERGAEAYSRIISAVHHLPQTGNRLFCPGIILGIGGTSAKIIEVTYPEKEVVFEATIHFKNLLAAPGAILADNVYRSYRIPIYP